MISTGGTSVFVGSRDIRTAVCGQPGHIDARGSGNHGDAMLPTGGTSVFAGSRGIRKALGGQPGHIDAHGNGNLEKQPTGVLNAINQAQGGFPGHIGDAQEVNMEGKQPNGRCS